MTKRTIYHPPPRKVFDEYARQVCERLAQRDDHAGYTNPDVVWGLARFLELCAVILAKHLNADGEGEEKVANTKK